MPDLFIAYHSLLYNLSERVPNVCLALSTFAQRMSNVWVTYAQRARRSADGHVTYEGFEYKYGADLDVCHFAKSSPCHASRSSRRLHPRSPRLLMRNQPEAEGDPRRRPLSHHLHHHHLSCPLLLLILLARTWKCANWLTSCWCWRTAISYSCRSFSASSILSDDGFY